MYMYTAHTFWACPLSCMRRCIRYVITCTLRIFARPPQNLIMSSVKEEKALSPKQATAEAKWNHLSTFVAFDAKKHGKGHVHIITYTKIGVKVSKHSILSKSCSRRRNFVHF